MVVENMPNGVLTVLLTWPVPWQLSQVTISDSESAPEPLHLLHTSILGILICFLAPNATSTIPRTKIESLFLDEGFGTLDTETLETALAALDHVLATRDENSLRPDFLRGL